MRRAECAWIRRRATHIETIRHGRAVRGGSLWVGREGHTAKRSMANVSDPTRAKQDTFLCPCKMSIWVIGKALKARVNR